MFPVLFLLFTLVPASELYLLFAVGSHIGALNTIFIIIGTGILGASLAKMQGLQLIYQVQHELNQGKIPGTKIIEGFCVFGGGLLLLTPGFMTDILGFCMILPGPRNLMALFLKKYFAKAAKNGNFQFQFFGNMQGGPFGAQNPFENQNPFEQTNNNESNTFDAEYSEKKSDNIISVDFEKKDEKDL